MIALLSQALEHRTVCLRSPDRRFASRVGVAPRSLVANQLPRRAWICSQLGDLARSVKRFVALAVVSSGAEDAAGIDPRIAAAADGDRAAAQALLAELLPRVRNLIRYLVRSDDDVDDITQEALIAIARGFGSFRGQGALTAWADRIVARATFAHLRKTRRDHSRRSAGADLSTVPHPGAPPDQYTARRQLVRLLDQIPHDQRSALVLHHAMGMQVPEIAAQLDISAETIRSRLRLGKAKLRALIEHQHADAGESQ